MKNTTIILAAALLLLPACGKKGPLVLEPEKLPPPVTGLGLRQVGHEIELSWKYPALLSDGKTPLLAAQVRSVAVHHLAKPFSPEAFEKKSELLARFKAAELSSRPDGFFAARRAVQGQAAQGQGARLRPVLPVRQVALGPEQRGKDHDAHAAGAGARPQGRPRGQDRDPELEPAAGRQRGPAPAGPGRVPGIPPHPGGKDPGAFVRINATAVPGEYYQDRDTGSDGEYEYQVASLLEERIESVPSNVVRLRIQDTFPPDMPANLVTFMAKDHLFLTWEAVRDRDLHHYVVYRKSPKEEDFKILDAAVGENFFRDRQVTKGQTYVYAVAAVDDKGNESEPSRPVRQLFE